MRAGAKREQRNGKRHRQECQARLHWAEAEDPFKYSDPRKKHANMPIGPGRVHAGACQAAHAQNAQRHDRVRQSPLEEDEAPSSRTALTSNPMVRGEVQPSSGPARSQRWRPCAEAHQHRAEHIDALTESHAAGALEENAAEQCGGQTDGEVDEEIGVPVDRLGEHAAEEQPDSAAADGGKDVGAHRASARGWIGELAHDDGDDDRRGDGAADALHQTGGDEQHLIVRQPAGCRGGGEDDETGDEDGLATDEVAEAAGEEQEAAVGDEVAVDDQVRLAWEKWRSAWMVGRATLTMVPSRVFISCARQTTTRANQRR